MAIVAQPAPPASSIPHAVFYLKTGGSSIKNIPADTRRRESNVDFFYTHCCQQTTQI
jgi:hypothetical protein